MRIGCLQFAPQVGDVDNNLNRADSVLSKANLDDLDLLVLPELAFSGYNFKSLQDIAPFLEPSGSGITSLWARTIALKYNCIVTVGYPEKVDVSPKWPTGPEYYNSAIVVNGDGETIANYRKNFLYYTDETWALEGGRGFFDGFIPGLGNTSIGICMDINPYKFEAPWSAFEFAFHILEMESNLVIVSMAWMTREEPRDYTRMPNEPDMETLTYWVTRLEPLIRSENQDEIIVVFCNRTGNEDNALYAGTSAVVGIHDGEVKVYGLLGRGEKELLVVDTHNPPYAKLVYRPDADGPGMEAPGTLQKESDTDSKKQNPKSPGDDSKPDEPKLTTSGDEGKQQSATTDSKKNFLPPSPKEVPPIQDESPSGSSKRRQAPTITIPSKPDPANNNSARSPGSQSVNIPTPSAPSPTPMALRPRLIIPESPPILPHQYPPDHPISAASLRSERSIRSVKSDQSDASGMTVRSNPRPPEESTPYPNTATPLSGYPSNAFSSPDKRILGGHVTIETQESTFSPDTPFDDMSPISPQWVWRPSDSRMQTPISAATWTPGTPMWRRPEPFPWPAITSATTSRPPSRSANQSRTTDNATPRELRQANSQSPQSNASSNRTNKTSKTVRSDSSVTSKGTIQAEAKNDRALARPSSPKSRNASRSRLNERSNSSLGNRDAGPAITNHLEGISRRAESVNKMREEAANASPQPDRPPSPKSRNCSRSRPGDDADFQKDHLIHVAASPSILKNEGRSPYRPLSRANHHQRSNSSTSMSGYYYSANIERPGASTGSNVPRPASRAASRGRAPGPKLESVFSTLERASSIDSTRNDMLHTRVPGRQSQSKQSRSGRTSSTQNARRPSQGGEAAEFERVEAVVCPSCPVHGQQSSTDQTQATEESVPAARTSPGVSHTAASVSNTEPPQADDLWKAEGSSGKRNSPKTREQKERHASTTFDPLAVSEVAEASDCSLSETLRTVSSPGRSPATPSFFNPATPRAMVLPSEDDDVEPLPNGLLDNVTEKTPTTCSAESDSIHTLDLPVGSVAT